MAATTTDDAVAVIGAGPAGLAVAAGLRGRGVEARVVDRAGVAGGAYREMYPALALASPASFNGLPGLALDAAGEYVTAGEYRAYLERYAGHCGIEVERGTVERIERRDGGGFEVTVDGRPAAARAVVVATGMWSFPVWPALPRLGPEIEVIHAGAWRGPAAHRPGTVLVIGGGTSAVEIAEQAAAAGRAVHVAARNGVKLVPQRLLGRDLHRWFAFLAHVPPWLARGYCARPPTHPAADVGFSRLRDSGRIRVHRATVPRMM